jgi:hypothetical protein
MFGLFKKKTELEKLELKHKKCLEDSFNLSKTNRTASDAKMAEAAEIQKQMDNLYEK